jgi:outer membrane protein TolC
MRSRSAWRIILLCASALLLASACSRNHHRLRADTESYHILGEKTRDARWSPPRTDIAPDPRSRFFDQYDPDFPPLPPDDPAAHEYMHHVYGMKGPKHWQGFEAVSHVENPMWTTYHGGEPYQGPQFPLPKVEKLGLQEAIELGLIHSREYQEQLENMYLAALSLTFERYRFDVRPLGFLGEPGTTAFYEHQPDDASNLGLGTSNLGISKLLPGGAQFIAELTNNTLWLFSWPNSTQSASTLAYSLVVPLLEGGKREIALESLTQSERRVLYTIRDFARFRKDFYTTIVTGERALPLPGSTRGGELAFLIRGERSPTVGFYFLLFRLQRARNQETNVRSLENLIRDLEQLSEAGRATSLDITQLKSSLATAQRRYILLDRSYQNELDRFKVQLGLPPDIEVEVDDDLIVPFQFLNSDLLALEDRISLVPIELDPTGWPTTVEAFRGLQQELSSQVSIGSDELRRLAAMIPARSARLEEDDAKQLGVDLQQDQQNFQEIRIRVEDSDKQLAELLSRLQTELEEDEQAEVLGGLRQIRRDMLRSVRELTGLQIGVRVELVMLQRVEVTLEDVVQIALANRLDLMNRRGFVMDARRRLEIAADRLEATLNVVAEGELNTPPLALNSQPFDFRAKQSNFRVGVSVVTPLDRIAAGNNFRAAQISYQRARRNYMAAEDQVKLDVRSQWRDVVAETGTFETNRRALRIAARELDQAIEFSERPDGGGGAGSQGVNISRALDNILDAQDELIESWVDFETARLSLYRDLGVMFIDENGFWVEDLLEAEDVPTPDAEDYPPPAEASIAPVVPAPPRRDRSSS